MKRLLTALATIMLTGAYCHVGAQENATADTTATHATAVAADSTEHRGFGKKIRDYFSNANKTKSDKKFDFSIIGGPYFNSNTKLGIGLVAAGLYNTDAADSLMKPSNVSLFGNVSTAGFYMLGVRGLHLFPHNKYRIDYTLYFYFFPSKYWGIGYDNGNNDDNESDMDRWQTQAKASFLIRLADGLYLGPMAAYDYIKATDVERPDLLDGMDTKTNNFGIGVSLVYDTRDVITNPHSGVYVSLEQTFRPRFLGNDYAFTTTEMRANAYGHVWKGATLAGDLRSTLNFGNPSWGMMAKLGGPFSMRGYYEGRYRDKHKIEAQMELRQQIWKRHGAVVWVGAGTVFNKFSSISCDKLLPNYGIGYRWEFKKDMNVRLDYGFGKCGQSSFMFSINEAF